MRPSKLRLPLSTDATTRSFSLTASETSCGSGPEFPMQVVHPYPTRLNFSLSRYVCSPAFARYSETTFEPGASDGFTHAGTVTPFSTAFFASNPAASMTEGFEVFVQLVIAAITTLPCFRFFLISLPFADAAASFAPDLIREGRAASNDF